MGTDPRKVFDLLEHAPVDVAVLTERRRHAGRRADPHRRDPGRHLHPGRRREGPAADRAPRSASTATSAPRRASLVEAGVDLLVIDTAHGHQVKMLDAIKSVVVARPRAAAGRGQRGVGGGHPRPDQRGRVDRQGRRRARRDVHHPDDDRRRPAAVLRGCRMCLGGKATRWPRVGRRRCPASARRGAGAGRRGVQRDDRLVVRRHLRVARRPDARPRRPAVQGELRHGVQAGGGRPHRGATAAFDRARKALFEEGISTSRMGLDPARGGVEDLLDHITSGVRSTCTYVGAATLAELHDEVVVGVQSAAGFAEGHPLPDRMVRPSTRPRPANIGHSFIAAPSERDHVPQAPVDGRPACGRAAVRRAPPSGADSSDADSASRAGHGPAHVGEER